MADVADEDRPDAELEAVQDVLDAERELIGAAQRRAEHAARAAGRLHADVPARARADEEAHLDVVRPPERDHLPDLGVGLQHDAAALADRGGRRRRARTPLCSTASIARGPSVDGISIRY